MSFPKIYCYLNSFLSKIVAEIYKIAIKHLNNKSVIFLKKELSVFSLFLMFKD
jgi:hypothetical protein